MFDKLSAIEAQYHRLMTEMADPAVQGDQAKFRAHSKTLADMQPLVERFGEYKKVISELTTTEELMKDPDMRELAQAELTALEGRREDVAPQDVREARRRCLQSSRRHAGRQGRAGLRDG